MTDQEMIMAQVTKALLDLKVAGKLQPGAQMVVGCSTSEIAGGRIGKASVPQIGEWVAQAVLNFCQAQQLTPIFQCCEHLNRALVIPRSAAEKHGYRQVCAIPQPKAGGSVPAAAWKLMEDPCLVMAVQADAGLDIGDTLIGMHLRPGGDQSGGPRPCCGGLFPSPLYRGGTGGLQADNRMIKIL